MLSKVKNKYLIDLKVLFIYIFLHKRLQRLAVISFLKRFFFLVTLVAVVHVSDLLKD